MGIDRKRETQKEYVVTTKAKEIIMETLVETLRKNLKDEERKEKKKEKITKQKQEQVIDVEKEEMKEVEKEETRKKESLEHNLNLRGAQGQGGTKSTIEVRETEIKKIKGIQEIKGIKEINISPLMMSPEDNKIKIEEGQKGDPASHSHHETVQ